MSIRQAVQILRGKETYDGAGVKLTRVFAHKEATSFDPFLLLDAFGSDDPKDYIAGFPMHPHRGIETVTYLLEGSVRHRDSTGSGGIIGPGDLQWMSAGSGILHEEMPQNSPHGVHGLQLWINLPSREKMRAPAYRGVTAAEIPVVPTGRGLVRVIAGSWGGAHGPIIGVSRSPVYLDVTLDDNTNLSMDIPSGRTAFVYLLSGELHIAESKACTAGTCVLLGDGDEMVVSAGPAGVRFVLAHALPICESIAWGGPIVMNTHAELELAFRQLDEGTFIQDA